MADSEIYLNIKEQQNLYRQTRLAVQETGKWIARYVRAIKALSPLALLMDALEVKDERSIFIGSELSLNTDNNVLQLKKDPDLKNETIILTIGYPNVDGRGVLDITAGDLREARSLVKEYTAEELTEYDTNQYHGLDTPYKVFFYEQDFYVLSNFSSFQVVRWDRVFQTSEHAYHYARFYLANTKEGLLAADRIYRSRSAHDAYKLAQELKHLQVANWDEIKVGVMKEILMLKVDQHEYVKQKLLATGDRVLIENSWRDSFWGWGEDMKGANTLGVLWMEIRNNYRMSK